MATLKDEFEDAKKRVMTLPKAGPEVQLKLYGLYKQATAGDATGKRPGLMDIRGRAKFDAWTSRKGMNADDAMNAYIDYVDELLDA